jgi:hypothetical protein
MATSCPDQNYRPRLHFPECHARGADDLQRLSAELSCTFPERVDCQCLLPSIRPDSYLASLRLTETTLSGLKDHLSFRDLQKDTRILVWTGLRWVDVV